MTFIISSNGVSNTEGTTAKFGAGGIVKVGGNFQNTGNVEIDVRANLQVIGNIINAGNFSVKDYLNEGFYESIEKAIDDLKGEPKKDLQKSYQSFKLGYEDKANNYFRNFFTYIQQHPELVTSSVQILLQLFLK